MVLWVFEMEPFATAPFALGQAVAKATAKGAFSLVGGGFCCGSKTIRSGR